LQIQQFIFLFENVLKYGYEFKDIVLKFDVKLFLVIFLFKPLSFLVDRTQQAQLYFIFFFDVILDIVKDDGSHIDVD
jgi:hypothetical protein